MSKTIEKNKLTVTIKDFYGNSVYIGYLYVQTEIMIKTKRTYLLPSSTSVEVFLIDQKLLSLCLCNFQNFCLFLLNVFKLSVFAWVDYFCWGWVELKKHFLFLNFMDLNLLQTRMK